MDSVDVYRERGFGGRSGAGKHPALVVIDLCNGFTDPESPLHCDCDGAVDATAKLLEAARASGSPVAYTTIEYDAAGEQIAKAFIAKSPGLLTLAPGSRWIEIDERIAPAEGEAVLFKLFASGFFGTSLGAFLSSHGCDTVVITGASTSGCVRATAVDALQHGYRVIVPREGVADRAQGAHDATLTDLDAKYADVVGLEDAIEIFSAAEY